MLTQHLIGAGGLGANGQCLVAYWFAPGEFDQQSIPCENYQSEKADMSAAYEDGAYCWFRIDSPSETYYAASKSCLDQYGDQMVDEINKINKAMDAATGKQTSPLQPVGGLKASWKKIALIGGGVAAAGIAAYFIFGGKKKRR